MTAMWILGGLLVTIGVALLVAALVQKGRSPESQRLTIVAAVAMVAIGAVAFSAGALAGDDDDGREVSADASDTTTTAAAPDDQSSDDASPLDKDDDGTGTGSASNDGTGSDDGSSGGETPLPECFDDHLGRSPRVHPDDHYRLDIGVDERVLVVMHQLDAVAVELVDDDEVLGVLRVADQVMPVEDILLVHDAVDAGCEAVPYTPAETADDVAGTHTTVIPLQLAGRNYEVTFVQNGVNPELEVVLRQV